MRRSYERWSPQPDAMRDLLRAEAICEEYRAAGYSLTLRQLYYQFVARDFIPNSDRSYKRLGSIVNRGRMAGYLDWDMIEDRTRNLRSISHWDTPGDVIRAAAQSYHNDLWSDQDYRVEVWVEKEALAGVIQRVASQWDCPWFSCRGYVSQSELWGAGRRLGGYIEDGKRVVVLHLGDHDPSGIDMTRDITDRLRTFVLGDWSEGAWCPAEYLDDEEEREDATWRFFEACDGTVGGDDAIEEWDDLLEVRRIALNMDQVREWAPPPNPAKLTDSRAVGYIDRFGRQSWELDALPPDTLAQLIADNIASVVDMDRLEAARDRQETDRTLLTAASASWSEIAATLA